MEKKEESLIKLSVPFKGIDPLKLLGFQDEYLNYISKFFGSQIIARKDRIRILGPKEEAYKIRELFLNLMRHIKKNNFLTKELINEEITLVKGEKELKEEKNEKLKEKIKSDYTIATPKKIITPQTKHQEEYLKAIDEADIVICIGPAGTGKTYLAVAKAVSYLLNGKVARIILTRPAVEAGEQLGYLPGDFKEKVAPYLRPLYDALYDMMPIEKVKRMIEEEIIEIAPLAYMRGRTLSDAFIILDEGQNTTKTQMKMFLTRLGWNSKAVVTGDVTQIDLSSKYTSGLIDCEKRLKDIKGIKIIYFDKGDVTRPAIVSEIIKAYEEEI
ncbi:MAG: PhoH family protein [candidate division WOR-3 bacterium]|nr:PhoH family protein [candidate division WOR-3 bacterium]MCX7836927.1 PhoH family protein [candidate division WOR-3 bacterium]MDW8114591.1 PhoH family protein [candidate division WOR-3 bacterium]